MEKSLEEQKKKEEAKKNELLQQMQSDERELMNHFSYTKLKQIQADILIKEYANSELNLGEFLDVMLKNLVEVIDKEKLVKQLIHAFR